MAGRALSRYVFLLYSRWSYFTRDDLVKDRDQVASEAGIILSHGEVANPFHSHAPRSGNGCGRCGSLLRGTGVIVLTGQEVDWALGGVDLPFTPAEIPVDAVEIGVPPIDAGATLTINPPHVPPGSLRALGGHEPEGPHGGHLRSVHIRSNGPIDETSLYLTSSLQADYGSDLRAVAT